MPFHDSAKRLIAEAREDAAGFAGDFAFQLAHTEDRGVGNVADYAEIDDRLIYLPREDCDEDETVEIMSPICRHVAEPVARMLNRHGALATALEAALCEIEGVTRDRDRLAAEVEHLGQDGPAWLRFALQCLHSQVDRTDPSDPVGAALTHAGLERLGADYAPEHVDHVAHVNRLVAEVRRQGALIEDLRAVRDAWHENSDTYQVRGDRLTAELQEARAEVARLKASAIEMDEEDIASLRHFYGVHGHEFCAYCAKAKAFLEGVLGGASVTLVEIERLRGLVREACEIAGRHLPSDVRYPKYGKTDRDRIDAIHREAGIDGGDK